MLRLTLFLGFLPLATAAIDSAATLPGADVQQLIERSTTEITADWNQAPNYSFVERDVDSKRGSLPVKKTYKVILLDGSPYNQLIGIEDRPLSPWDQAEQKRKLQSEIRKRQRESPEQRSRRISKYQRERHEDFALLKAMVDAFTFQMVGSETLDDHECWILDASPNPGYRPTNRETKVLTGMRGRLWIDKASGQWVKVRAQVFEAVSLYGFFAKVRPGTEFLLEQAPVGQNLWLPTHFRTQVRASVLGVFNEDSTEDETYSDYRPMAQTLAQLHAP
jgi:hypothetical protein